MTTYENLARIAIKEIVSYYGEESPCCYCITRPICSKLCFDTNVFLRQKQAAYLFKSDLGTFRDEFYQAVERKVKSVTMIFRDYKNNISKEVEI